MRDPVRHKVVRPTEDAFSAECAGVIYCSCSRAYREKFVCNPVKNLTDYEYALIIVDGLYAA